MYGRLVTYVRSMLGVERSWKCPLYDEEQEVECNSALCLGNLE